MEFHGKIHSSLTPAGKSIINGGTEIDPKYRRISNAKYLSSRLESLLDLSCLEIMGISNLF